jgi:uncharacterized small protein (DUF1192 family)
MEEEAKTEETQEQIPAEEKPLLKMTAIELREIALQIPGVTGVHAMKKDKLLSVIKEHRGIKDEEPVIRPKIKPDSSPVSAGELKQRIAALREQKEISRAAKDRNKVAVLRRRIHRLKKRMRKVAKA